MRRKLWSKDDLIIAYYIAKCSMQGLDISKPDLIKEVIKGTTLKSLGMQVQGFKNLLGIDVNWNVNSKSKLKLEIFNELKSTPNSEVKEIVLKIINDSRESFYQITSMRKKPSQLSLF